MSTEREIRLVGSFKDDITPKLEKLNKTITETVRTFSRFTRALRPLAKEMGTIAYAGRELESSLASQRNSFQAVSRSMVAYRRELRRTASLQKMVAGGRLIPSDFMAGPRATRAGTMRRPTTRASYSERLAAAGRGGAGGISAAPMAPIPQMPRTPRAPRGTQAPMMPMMPAAPMAPGGRPPRAPGGRPPVPPAPRGGASVPAPSISGPSMADGAAGAAFGVTLGNQIGSIVTNAIMTGFQKSMQLIKKPFTFLAHEFGHAMGEEMADITAAGAMFALDKSSGTKMFKDFEDARLAQEMLDQRLAKSAGSLPGETLQYVQQARQLQDTIMMALGKDQEGFMKKAEEMGAIAGNLKDSFAVVLSQFTERAVLLGQDQGSRSGGLGVPQLLERMVTMDKVNVAGMSTKFGALISNPLLKGALERNEAAINATTVGTIERIQAIQKALDEALPQEVITAMTMTMKGISEGFRSSLFDISSGLFGIRRMVTGVKAQAFKMTGDIKSDTAEALSLFDMLRDTIGFFAVPFQQLTNILPQIYDPMLGLIDTLIPLRKVGATFSSVFHQFSADYEAFAKEAFPDLKTQSKFLETRGPRAALMAIGALLEDFDPSFSADQTAAELRKLDADFGKVAKDLITRLLNSDVMEMIGETVGNFASELLTVMANLLTGVTDFATTSRFAKGLVKGLEGRIGKDGEKIGMGAWEAIRKIFDKVFEIMGKLLLTIVTQMPMQTALFFGITAVLPAALAALGTKIGATLAAVLSNAGATIQTSLLGTKAATTAAAGAGAATTAAVSGGTAQAAITGKAAPVAGAAAAKTGMFAGLSPIVAILAPIGKALGAILLVLTVALGFTVGWETTFKALGMAFDEMKTAIGGTIGPILSGLGETAKGLWDGFWSLVQLFIPLNNTFLDTASETDKLKAAIIAFKIVLWPIVGAFQLLEQFVNLLESAVKIIELFVLALRISLAELNPKNWMGDSAELTSLRKQQKEKETEASATFAKFGQAFERHSAYYTTSVDKAANSVNNFADATDKAKFSFGGPAQPAPAAGIASPLLAPPAPVLPPPPNPIPAIEALSVNQIAANTHLAQIDAKTLPQHQVNPVPPLETIISGLEGAKAYILQVESQIKEAGSSVVSEITSSGNATQAKVQETTSAVNSLQASVQATTTAVTNLSGKLSGPIDVKVVNSPTIKFDMGGMGPVGGSIGNFPKTSGYGMRWGRLHAGNDYGMPVGTKLGIGGPGKVLGAGYWGGYGNAMDIGGPGGMVYRFAHLSKINAPVGANLPPGYPFALSGNTGMSTGPHLHFEARPGGGGPVNPDAFAGIIRANFAGTPLGPLMGAMKTEMQNMPYGSQLAVSNSDEIFMKPKQMAHVIESSARAGAEGTGNVSMNRVTINVNPLDNVLTASNGMIGPDWLPWNWGKLVDKERSSGTNKLSPQGRYGHVTDPEMRRMLGLPALPRAMGNLDTTLGKVLTASNGMIGPDWLPWNWGKLVDKERSAGINKTTPKGRYGDVTDPELRRMLGAPALPRAMGNLDTTLGKVLTASDGMIGPGWLPWNWGKVVDKERSAGINKTTPKGRYGDVTDPELRRMLGAPALPRAMGNLDTTLGKVLTASDGMIGPGWLPWNWGKVVDKERSAGINKTTPKGRYGDVTDPELRRMLGAPALPRAMGNFGGTLLDAVKYEMKHKPPGSSLVIANSSETIIPAANGLNNGTSANVQTGPITISIEGYNKDPKELADSIASELLTAIHRKSRSEVLTS